MGKTTEDPDIIMSAKGVNGTLYLLPGRIRIAAGGCWLSPPTDWLVTRRLRSGRTHPSSGRSRDLTNATSSFAFIGGTEGKKGRRFQATQDENTIMFNSGQAKAFEAIKKAVEAEIYAPTDPQPVPASSTWTIWRNWPTSATKASSRTKSSPPRRSNFSASSRLPRGCIVRASLVRGYAESGVGENIPPPGFAALYGRVARLTSPSRRGLGGLP